MEYGQQPRNASAHRTPADVTTASSSVSERAVVPMNEGGVDENSARVLWRFDSSGLKGLATGDDVRLKTSAIREHVVQMYLATTFQ